MSAPPTFAIVTPSFNTGRFIGEAVRSVLEQDYPHVNYIVMDGGSTDQTLDVLRGFGDRLAWVSGPDGGQSAAINAGFARLDGDILGWLNSDDTLEPGALRVVADYFAQNPGVAMVYGDADFIDAGGTRIARCAHVEPFSRRRLFHYSDIVVQPAAFFRRSAFEAVGGLDGSLHWAMDYELFIKIAKRFDVAYLPRLLAHYRWLTDNKSAIGGWKRLDECRAMLARQGFGEAAYFRLERVNLHARDALADLKAGRVLSVARHCGRAARAMLSHRALLSVVNPHTWRIIWTGQVLRARAARSGKGDAEMTANAPAHRPPAQSLQ